MSTPCTELGYEVGQVFERTVENKKSLVGEILVLINDDGTFNPRFLSLTGDNKGSLIYPTLNKVKRIYPPEELSKEVTVTCEGKETTLSRESAKELNLI